MSVAIGLRDWDHVVLCADRQMTDANAGLKFEECKIVYGENDQGQHSYKLGLTYCGDPDAAKNVFPRVREAIEAALEDEETGVGECNCHMDSDYFRGFLQSAFNSKETKRLETLIALQATGCCFLFKTKADQIVSGGRECIGGGDSSVLRFFADVVSRTEIPSPEKALTLGIYLVSLANRYVDGCGLGVDALVFEDEKPFRVLSKTATEKYSERFAQFERQIEKEFFAEPSNAI